MNRGTWQATVHGFVRFGHNLATNDQTTTRHSVRASLVAQMVKNLPVVQETQVRSLGQEDPLDKEMTTHSSILAWGIPWTEEPGRL